MRYHRPHLINKEVDIQRRKEVRPWAQSSEGGGGDQPGSGWCQGPGSSSAPCHFCRTFTPRKQGSIHCIDPSVRKHSPRPMITLQVISNPWLNQRVQAEGDVQMPGTLCLPGEEFNVQEQRQTPHLQNPSGCLRISMLLPRLSQTNCPYPGRWRTLL